MDVSGFIHAAADAAKKQQDEYKEQMQDIFVSMEREMAHMQKSYEESLQNAIQQAENDAARKVDLIQKEMQQTMQKFEVETTQTAELEIKHRCAEMQKSLESQYQSQCEKLATEWEIILQEKDIEFQRQLETVQNHNEVGLQQRIEALQRQHDLEIESLKNEVDIAIESQEMMNRVASEADEQCQALRKEIEYLQGQLQEKDCELKNNVDNMADLDHTFKDVAKEINARHQCEVVQISNEKLFIVHENERLRKRIDSTERVNTSLKEELEQLRLKYKTMERKAYEQEELIRALDQRKTEATHHVAEFQSSKQLLERQLFELKTENASLTKDLQQKNIIISEMTAERNEQALNSQSLEVQIAKQKKELDDLQSECLSLKRSCTDANERYRALQRESNRCSHDMEQQMSQKDRQLKQLADAFDEMSKRSHAKTEPVVVHLHGNDGSQKQSASVTDECHHLRTRLLDLQRSNYRLESDLLTAKQQCQANCNVQGDSLDLLELQQENNGLKQIVTMMRKEMEQMLRCDESEATEAYPSYDIAIKQQLLQCHAYLDILLRSRDVYTKSDQEDELHFLRSRYKELNEENLRLQGLHVYHSDTNKELDNSASIREQELVQKLEEAADEIEALLEERDRLLTLSNDLKAELQCADKRSRQANTSSLWYKDAIVEDNQILVSAILDDLSRSCDGESIPRISEDKPVVACFGAKHPLSDSSNYASSKCGYRGGLKPTTASARATDSQNVAYQRLTDRTNQRNQNRHSKGKPPRVRNWNRGH